MNRRRFITGAVIIGILALVGVWKFFGQEKAEDAAKQKKPLPLVAAQEVKTLPISRTVELTGSVTATQVARLASPSEGPVQNCRVREGDQVKRGQCLVTIGRSGAAAAQVTAAAESLKEQQAELNRVKILVQSGAIPGSQLDSARAKYEGARAQLSKAKESIGDYCINVPWDGMVSKVLVKDGDFVAPRTPLVEMYDPGSLVIRFAVPEAQATEVFKGMPLQVHLDAHPNKDFQGKISRVYPDLDTKSRTRTVEAELDYPLALIPGMFARLKLPLQTVAGATVVPREAVIVTPSGERIAFVLKDGKALRRKLETGIEGEGLVQIITGLQPGDKVVVAGNEKLRDGMEVKAQGGGGK
ncbi:MAG: efflux RND transporter periplasmic adaptor subunit [Desulfobaccales bacterium]